MANAKKLAMRSSPSDRYDVIMVLLNSVCDRMRCLKYASVESFFLIHRTLLTRTMNKSFLIVTFSHLRCCPQLRRNSLGFVAFAIGGLIVAGTLSPAVAQDTADAKSKNDAPVAEPQPKASEPQPKSAPAYPLAVAVSGNDVYTVDLDLPGVWPALLDPPRRGQAASVAGLARCAPSSSGLSVSDFDCIDILLTPVSTAPCTHVWVVLAPE